MENDENRQIDDMQGGDYESVMVTVFQRIVTDSDFKSRLLTDPETALAEYDLSDIQVLMIKSLSEEDLNKLTPENLEEFFAADAAVYTPDEADLLDFETYNPEDFEELE